MMTQKLNSGIIYTTTDCIGCNKCISGCIAVGANVMIKSEDVHSRYQVLVDPNKCVLCGHCVKECVHKARTYRDDTDAFFEALERGEAISILVAPALLTDYEQQYNNILGYLKSLGVQHIYNSSFGADIMVWVYMNFIHDFGLSGVISQFCPVIVNYLEKYKPELLDFLMPVQSPMMCTAIYVSDYLKITDKLAYIGPCIAEKYEIDDINTYGKVSYNVTFERLMERLDRVDLSPYYAEDEVSYGLGALVSTAGGLSNNIRPYIGFHKVLIQTSGYSNIFPYFDHYYEECTHNAELPFLVDVLSCTNGCNLGTGSRCTIQQHNAVTFSAHRAKENAYASENGPKGTNHEERLQNLNLRFAEFATSSFVRQYNRVGRVRTAVLAPDDVEEIYRTLYMETPEERDIDCGACGYRTCREMVNAIGLDLNHKENCIHYAKQRIRLETEKSDQLLREISNMNDELKQSAKLKSNFLANMSHEIRTPMNAVIGMAELALRGPLGNEERGYIQQIQSSGRSLLAIINDILDFSKIESGKMELNEIDYSIKSLLGDTANMMLTRIGDKNLTLIVVVDPNIPLTLHGDDIRIKQVMINLANNAVKFTQMGTVAIHLAYQRAESGIWLEVSIYDTGVGIKPEDLAKLFNSFEQVDSTRNRNIEGAGLGLAISRELVKLMGGEVSVESTYGQGSVFSFRIPQRVVVGTPSVVLDKGAPHKTASFIANRYVRLGFLHAAQPLGVQNTECLSVEDLKNAVKDGAAFLFIEYALWSTEVDAYAKTLTDVHTVVILDPHKDIVAAGYVQKLAQPVYSIPLAAVLSGEAREAAALGARTQAFRFEAPEARVLVVDDNAINLTVAKGLLAPLHMQITTAGGAREALALIQETRFDIVLMDHMMPEIDGVEATHIIRAMDDEYYRTLPIIALTANAINEAREMFLQEGMNDFVAKPIEVADIVAKIQHWLPPEKVRVLGGAEKAEAAAITPAAAEAEQPEAAELRIDGLDVKAGIALSGTIELYKKILSIFHGVIPKKADAIEKALAERDLQTYTIETHSLKSSAKLIGATTLSVMAAGLEKCGHQGDWEGIAADTPALLAAYRAMEPLLAPHCPVEELGDELNLTPAQRSAKLSALYTALDDFNINDARKALDQLLRCPLEGAEAALRAKLNETVDAVEYDEAMELVNEWRNALTE